MSFKLGLLPDQDEIILERFEEALYESALASSTVVNYLADLRAFLRWGKHETGRDFSFFKVTQQHIRLYRTYLIHPLNRAASTVNRHLMSLRKFFAFARQVGAVSEDPTAGIALVQDDGQALSRPLSVEESEKLLGAAIQFGARASLVRRDVAILQLLLDTGLRVSEVINLKKDDLIFDNPGVHLRVGNSDSGTQARHLPLSNKACRALREYLLVRPKMMATPHFFLSQEGRPISSRTVQRIISDCARAAGLEGVSAQSLRRTFALQLFMETQDLELVSKQLGHQSKTITEQYLSVHDQADPYHRDDNL